jgi:hypothetical protein
MTAIEEKAAKLKYPTTVVPHRKLNWPKIASSCSVVVEVIFLFATAALDASHPRADLMKFQNSAASTSIPTPTPADCCFTASGK